MSSNRSLVSAGDSSTSSLPQRSLLSASKTTPSSGGSTRRTVGAGSGGSGGSSRSVNNGSSRDVGLTTISSAADDGGIVVQEYPAATHPTTTMMMVSSSASSTNQQQQSAASSANNNNNNNNNSDWTVPPDLAPLTNDASPYADVCRVCFALTQFAGHGGSAGLAVGDGDSDGSSSCLRHDRTFQDRTRAALAALVQCLREHRDRRCRAAAAATLAVTARAAYSSMTVQQSPWLHPQRSPQSQRLLQDELAADVPTALVTAVLEDADEGVAAAAACALARLLLPPASDDSNSDNNNLLHRPSPYAPSWRSVTDRDAAAVARGELWDRVAASVLQPRLAAVVDRVLQFGQSRHQATALAVIVPTLIHVLQHQAASLAATTTTDNNNDHHRGKRWAAELDAAGAGLLHSVVTGLLVPLMRGLSGFAALAAAQGTLRLLGQAAQCCGGGSGNSAILLQSASVWAVAVLQEQLTAVQCTETVSQLLSQLVVALRVLPTPQQRTAVAIWTAREIATGGLPSTVPAPTAASGALRVSDRIFRRPARMALWTELAIGFFFVFVEDVCGETTTTTSQSNDNDAAAVLKAFLTSPAIAEFLDPQSSSTSSGKSSSKHHHNQSVLPPRDELLLAFTATAIHAGRRLRNSTSNNADDDDDESNSAAQQQQQAWLQRAWVVLTCFRNVTVTAPVAGAYLDENLSLRTAGLASYVQLLQEYLSAAGRLHPPSSVALKLCGNALPPHLLWDKLTESASYLARLGGGGSGSSSGSNNTAAATVVASNTTKLMDELVARELKPGIPSHHVRLFALALAADHWVQGRIAAIQQLERDAASSSSSSSKAKQPQQQQQPDLNMASARDILRALAPKRLLAKVSRAHVPPVDKDGKPKRDPIKKLALEHVRVSVAGIESIALMACDWRRRYGSSQETKHIMSVAVGLLQGKVDETPVDDLIKSVLGPTCEAAVHRIHAFYEGSSKTAEQQQQQQSFPVSELLTQHVKIKIKPLVSSSKLNPRPPDDVQREYLMQLCRQMVEARLQRAVLASPPADSLLTPARSGSSSNWWSTVPPPIAEARDGRLYGAHGDATSAWGHCVRDCTTPSDPAQVVLAYIPRRNLRYDGEDDFGITAVMRVHNMTPIDFVEGVRLELGIVQDEMATDAENDLTTRKYVESLGGTVEDLVADLPLSSMEVMFKQELRSGEYITWEVPLTDLPACNNLKLVPSVVYRNVPVEAQDAGATHVGEKAGGADKEGDSCVGANNSGEDDFQVTVSNDAKSFREEQAEIQHVRLTCEPLALPPMIVFQPCPLVFFTDRCGDVDSFRFLWFRFPHQLASMNISPAPKNQQRSSQYTAGNPVTRKIASMASLTWDGEAIPGGFATNLWAFMTLTGHRLYCVLTENDDQTQQTLHFRGDDRTVLYSIVGSKASRQSVVTSLLPGMVPAA